MAEGFLSKAISHEKSSADFMEKWNHTEFFKSTGSVLCLYQLFNEFIFHCIECCSDFICFICTDCFQIFYKQFRTLLFFSEIYQGLVHPWLQSTWQKTSRLTYNPNLPVFIPQCLLGDPHLTSFLFVSFHRIEKPFS